MRVGFLQAYFTRAAVGGGELHTEALAHALDRRGHDVTIFTDRPRTDGDGSGRRDTGDLDVREYPTPANLNPVNELVLAQRAFDDMQACDVVVLTDDSAWRGVDLPVPTVMVFHLVWHGWVARHGGIRGTLLEKPQALLYAAMERKIARKADAIVAISENMREDVLRIGGTGDVREKLHAIPNGVDVDRFTPDAAPKADRFSVHFQGRLVGMKNPDRLVEAVRRSEGDWRLTIGGTGPLEDDLRQRVREHGLGDRVEFLGYVDDADLPATYARSHVYALPSTYEGMPLSVLEAAASGCAVVASERAATEFVTDEMGVVFNGDPDPVTLAQTLDDLAASSERVAAMGSAARERAENYSWATIAARYEGLFDELAR